MPPRYKIAPKFKAFDDEDEEEYGDGENCEVFCTQGGHYHTGLLDANGNPIIGYKSEPSIGFLWHDEEGQLRPKHVFFDDAPNKVWVTESCEKELSYREGLSDVSPNAVNFRTLWGMLAGDLGDMPNRALTEEEMANLFGLKKIEEEDGAE